MSSRCFTSLINNSKFLAKNQIFELKTLSAARSLSLKSRSFVTWRSLSKKVSNNKLLFTGLVGVCLYGVYDYRKIKKSQLPALQNASEEEDMEKLKEYSSIKATRKIRGSNHNQKYKLTLFQYQSCPFCCKVRAFLNYHGFSYNIIEVNSVTRKQIKWSGVYKKVPILMVEDKQTGDLVMLKDSSGIISCLYSAMIDPSTSLTSIKQCYPTIVETNKKEKLVYDVANKYRIMYGEYIKAPKDFLEVSKKREWVDKHFVHTISPNLYRTPSEALQAFKIFAEVGEWQEVFGGVETWMVVGMGSIAMFFIGKMLKKRHNLSSDVRQDLYNACDDWMKVVKKSGGKFMGGAEPNLADLAVYGVMTSMQGTCSFDDMMANTKVKDWFNEVKGEVTKKEGKRLLDDKVGQVEVV